MPEIEIKTKGYKCNKCNHTWIARKGQYDKLPALCPKCKTPYWNKDKNK